MKLIVMNNLTENLTAFIGKKPIQWKQTSWIATSANQKIFMCALHCVTFEWFSSFIDPWISTSVFAENVLTWAREYFSFIITGSLLLRLTELHLLNTTIAEWGKLNQFWWAINIIEIERITNILLQFTVQSLTVELISKMNEYQWNVDVGTSSKRCIFILLSINVLSWRKKC